MPGRAMVAGIRQPIVAWCTQLGEFLRRQWSRRGARRRGGLRAIRYVDESKRRDQLPALRSRQRNRGLHHHVPGTPLRIVRYTAQSLSPCLSGRPINAGATGPPLPSGP